MTETEHCWHNTLEYYTTNPVKRIQQCCVCDDKRIDPTWPDNLLPEEMPFCVKPWKMECVFREILYTPIGIRLCHTCGNYQSHRLLLCRCCGRMFCSHNHTLFEAIKICSKITYEDGKYAYKYRPAHQAAIYKRSLALKGYTEAQFISYIESKLNESV